MKAAKQRDRYNIDDNLDQTDKKRWRWPFRSEHRYGKRKRNKLSIIVNLYKQERRTDAGRLISRDSTHD